MFDGRRLGSWRLGGYGSWASFAKLRRPMLVDVVDVVDMVMVDVASSVSYKLGDLGCLDGFE